MDKLGLIQSKVRHYFNKSFGRGLFFGSAAILAVFLFCILVIGLGLVLKPAVQGDEVSSKDLFVKSTKNFVGESPQMTLVQKNSLVGISSPVTITSQTLGTTFGEEEDRKQIIEYTVKSGDNLSAIAESFSISLNTLLWANDLSSNSMLKVGQKLIVLPVSGVVYSVKKGDTLSQIAETYKGKVEEIIAFNEISGEGDIFIGDILVIPHGKMPARVAQIALTPLAESYFIFPCEGKITQGLHPFNAVDIGNKCGQPVVAAASGTVQRAGRVWTGGNRVTILHSNGVVSYYGHLSAILVQPGQTVSAGDIIGYIGNTGYTLGATGCHLHFEVSGAVNFLTKYPVGSYLSWKK